MQWLLLSLLSASTFPIFYQDYRTRTVTWFFFPLVLSVGIIYSLYYTDSVKTLIINTSINFCFLLLQFLFLIIFFRSRKIINQKIGMGDILFPVCSCTFFSPVNFIFFYILSLSFALCIHFLFLRFKKHNYQNNIPLAGLQAIFLFAFISINIFIGSSTVDDGWLSTIMNND
jgi:FtsH-binding integral membrane protein